MSMRWIDGHLDLAYLEVNGASLLHAPAPGEARCLSLPALREAGVEVCFGTIFTEPGSAAASLPHGYPDSDSLLQAHNAGLRQLEAYERWERAGEISLVRAPNDLNERTPWPKIVLLMEGADPIRTPDELGFWHARGLRIIGLTWATGTRYAGGNASEPGAGPLTGLGVELVRSMDELGMVHDVSHLSDAAFDGLLEIARGPVIASHSNCRALLDPKQRHLHDDQIRVVNERGGIVGLNLYSSFLCKGRRATIDDCIGHIERICEIMNHRHGVALGSDMDGGFGPSELPVGLDHPCRLQQLADALSDRGWNDDEVTGFASGNWRRFLSRALASEPIASQARSAERNTSQRCR